VKLRKYFYVLVTRRWPLDLGARGSTS